MGMSEFLLVGLAVGVVTGWFLAKRTYKRRASQHDDLIRSRFFEGLNYVLNEQPDKAIETFCQLVEVDSETLETHYALGNLFRKRGEVDRAIRIHQNIILRSDLSSEQRAEAVLALGRDYMKAGLFDRAESLFRELAGSGANAADANRYLVSIYELEKDWPQAIGAAEQANLNDRTAIAHYRCEIAARAMAGGDLDQARALYEQALEADSSCVRASLGLGHLFMSSGDFRLAQRHFLRVSRQRRELIGETFKPLERCFAGLQEPAGYRMFLEGLMVEAPGPDVVIASARLIDAEQGSAAAVRYLAEQARSFPALPLVRDLLEYADHEAQASGTESGQCLDIGTASGVVRAVCDQRMPYVCSRCGFQSRALYWQCPSCKSWSTIQPDL